jgi:hypothetical protein
MSEASVTSDPILIILIKAMQKERIRVDISKFWIAVTGGTAK